MIKELKISNSDFKFFIRYELYDHKELTEEKDFESEVDRDVYLRVLLTDILMQNFETHIRVMESLVVNYDSPMKIIQRCVDALKYLTDERVSAYRKNTAHNLRFFCEIVLKMRGHLEKVLIAVPGDKTLVTKRNKEILEFCEKYIK